jgi:hypothetical protein
VIEMSAASWLVGGFVPGLEREPQKTSPYAQGEELSAQVSTKAFSST